MKPSQRRKQGFYTVNFHSLKMLIDDYLPRFDVTERHEIKISGSMEHVYAATRELDFSDSLLIRSLFFLRGLPALFSPRNKSLQPLGLNLAGLLRSGFVLLEEKAEEELLLGLVGKFWTATGCIQRLEAKQYRDFTSHGYAKAAWNFSLHRSDEGLIELATETRVLCTDEMNRKRFLRYWRFVRPFSGLIRIAALRAIKRAAEHEKRT